MPKTKLITLADRLQYIIELKNFSHNDVARLCGVKQGSISYILANNLDRSKLAYDIAQGLNISYEWLTTGKGQLKSQLIYQIPLFNNLFDCLKFAQKQDASIVETFIYTEREALEKQSFAFDYDKGVVLICLISQTAAHHSGLFLNITNILNGEISIAEKPVKDMFYPIAEIRVTDYSKSPITIL